MSSSVIVSIIATLAAKWQGISIDMANCNDYCVAMATNSALLSKVVLARRLLESGVGQHVRLAAGISMGEMAAQVGIGITSYSRWEAGTRVPRPAAAVRYLVALEDLLGVVDPHDLEGITDA